MTESFDPVAELRSHGLVSDNVPQPAEEVLGKLGRYQIETFVKAKERADALSSPDVQAHSVDDGALALAMAKAMGWDRPAAEDEGSDVEAMAMAAPACACLCSTASGAGGGDALA